MKTSNERDKKREWSLQENTLLKDLYSTFSSKKWKKISQVFKQKGFIRTELEIRERWTNFEDPSILFTEWTDEELETLYRNYNKFGSKWCFIKKTIPGRTENKIKNKFYGNIRIYLRFVVNFFNDEKEDTMWIHKINPSILNDIYKGQKEFEEFGNEMELAICDMGYNIDKIRLLSRIENKELQYKSFYNKIIELFGTIDERKESASQRSRKENLRLSEINYGESEEEVEEEVENAEINSERQNTFHAPFQNYNSSVSISNVHLIENSNILSGTEMYSSNYPFLTIPNVYPYFNCWFYPN